MFELSYLPGRLNTPWNVELSKAQRVLIKKKKKLTPVYQEILFEARKNRVGILYGLALLPCQRLNLMTLSKLMF